MKKILRLGIFALIIVLGLLLGRNFIAKAAVETGVELVTGLKLNMQSLDIGLAGTSLGIESLRLFNPSGYRDKVMLDIPEVYVDYELQPLLKGKIHLEEIRLHLKEFVIVKNEKGELNLDSLKAVQSQKKEAQAEKVGKPKEKGKAPGVKVDSLKLRIEKVLYKDYSKGGEPSIKTYNININESYSNVKNLNAVVSLIVVKVMMSTGLATLTNFDLGPLQGSVSDALASSKQIAVEAVTKAQETLGETAGKLGETTEGLTKDLSQTASTLKEKLKLPFGKEE